MNWTVETLTEKCKEVCARADIPFTIPVQINGRLTRTLGRFMYTMNQKTELLTPVRIEFSRQLLQTATDASIISVIEHECAHYLVAVKTGMQHGHDKVFQAACALIGCTNDKPRTQVERTVAVRSKYEVWCDVCHEVVGEYARWCKTLENIDYCTCNKCKQSKLKVIQNW